MYNRAHLGILLSVLAGLAACAQLDKATPAAKPDGAWYLYSGGNLGRLRLDQGRYVFTPKADWVMQARKGGRPYFFVQHTAGTLDCRPETSGQWLCRANGREDIGLVDQGDACQWRLTHKDRSLPVVTMGCKPPLSGCTRAGRGKPQ